MKGIIFNLLEEVVTAEYGEDTWDVLLDRSSAGGAYTSLGSYADDELMKLVGAVSEALELPPDTVVRWFGERALPLLAERYPAFFSPHTSTRPFLLTLNDIIHPEVRKLYPGADVPVFGFDLGPNGTLVMTYRSERKLCSLAEGFLAGAAQHYGERVVCVQPRCMKRGDESCVLEIDFGH